MVIVNTSSPPKHSTVPFIFIGDGWHPTNAKKIRKKILDSNCKHGLIRKGSLK